MKHSPTTPSTPSTRTRRGARVLAATLALTLAGGAMAQGFPGRGDGPGPRWDQSQRYERDHDRRDRADRWERQERWDRDDRRDVRPGPPRPHAQWHRGGYVPASYRAPQYVVTDWRARHLQAPPSGYQWMQINGDFVLGAIAGGLIAAIVAGQ
ncbi:RcnB family protein [Xenophilus aerolatus]|nr:RcnB family protein [Xenophilus aerolatus]